MSDALADIWAKSAAEPGEAGERLAVHTAWVLTRLSEWRTRLPTLGQYSRSDIWDLAAWACLLHDVGKIARGFQSMVRGGTRFGHRHEVLSLVAVGWLVIPEEQRALVAAGVATHHRDWPRIRESYGSADERNVLMAEATPDAFADLRRWLLGEGAPSLSKLGFLALPALAETPPADAMLSAMSAVDTLFRGMSDVGSTAVDRRALAARRCAR